MTDLKLIDELLLDYMRALKLQPADMERHSSITAEAIQRLRDAYASGEMDIITLTWASYFRSESAAAWRQADASAPPPPR